MTLTDKTQARRLIRRQLLLTAVSALALLPFGWVYTYSILFGGLIATLGSVYFASRVFVRYRAERPDRLLGDIYRAEIAKLLIVASLFAAVVILISPISILGLLGGYLCVQMLAPLLNL